MSGALREGAWCVPRLGPRCRPPPAPVVRKQPRRGAGTVTPPWRAPATPPVPPRVHRHHHRHRSPAPMVPPARPRGRGAEPGPGNRPKRRPRGCGVGAAGPSMAPAILSCGIRPPLPSPRPSASRPPPGPAPAEALPDRRCPPCHAAMPSMPLPCPIWRGKVYPCHALPCPCCPACLIG